MTKHEDTTAAVSDPFERPVRPVAWMYPRLYGSGLSFTEPKEPYGWLDDDFGPFLTSPLYDQAALDAAVAAERERCAAAVRLIRDQVAALDPVAPDPDRSCIDWLCAAEAACRA